MYLNRHVEYELRQMANHFKMILITGARQVGKTTLLENVFPELDTITFDPAKDIQGARTDPDLFLQQHPDPIILDEVQYVPELLASLKRKVDKNENKGQYFMTGSQNLSMLKNIAESMAGRVGILHLGAMSLDEQAGTVDGKSRQKNWLSHYLACTSPLEFRKKITGLNEHTTLLKAMWRGGLPGLLTTPDEMVARYFSGYLKTYLERDVRTAAAVESIGDFEDLVGIMAALTAQEINYSQLGRKLDIESRTSKRWIDLLKQSYQWHDIKSYSGNVIKRVSQKRKGYFSDTGLACYLQGITSHEGLMRHPLRGALFETHMVNTIRTLLESMPFDPVLYHWRTVGGAEVDLIISMDGKLFPIEMKMKTNISGHDTRGLQAFRATYGAHTQVMPSLILYAGTDCYLYDENTILLPWNATV